MRATKISMICVCCTAFLLSACHNRPIPETDIGAVRFDVSSVTSRATAVKEPGDILSMGVFGYATGTDDFDPANASHTPNLIHNQSASRTPGGEWNYNPIVYWPLDLSVKSSFCAYSPHSSEFVPEANVIVSAANASGYPTLRYTIPSVLSDQKDIMYAKPVLNVNKNSNGGKVLYEMKHALAGLAFVVSPTLYHSPDETYTVTWLSFMADKLPITSTLNLGTGAWSTPTNTQQVIYEFELNAAAENIKPGEVASIVSSTDRLMLFPFEIDGKESAATIDLTFTYDSGTHSDVGDPEEYYYYMQFPTTRMSAGYVVIYIINISVDGVSIHFLQENRIEDWIVDPEGKVVEIL